LSLASQNNCRYQEEQPKTCFSPYPHGFSQEEDRIPTLDRTSPSPHFFWKKAPPPLSWVQSCGGAGQSPARVHLRHAGFLSGYGATCSNVLGTSSNLADDVVFMVPGRDPFGKAEFAAASEGLNNVRIEGSSDIQEIQVVGDWAYLRNYLEVTMTPDGGSPVRVRAMRSRSCARSRMENGFLPVTPI
jgi:hypothetical protein